MPRSSITILCLLLALFASLPSPGGAADKDKGKDPARKANRLAKESSPYLLQHAHNPVDWYPWGQEAFDRAKKENKLVFLSIGYSSCHWCHVMERESFANDEVAKLLNKHFVCIKVDREERPDIDNVYMTALQTLDIQGGWPLSMWLTPEGKPVVGGTYWPREDREIDGKTVKGFKSVLLFMADIYEKKPEKIREQADAVAELTTRALAGLSRGKALVKFDRALVASAVEALREEFDREYGGFGSAARKFRGTKFPTPPYLLFLQTELARSKSKEVQEMLDTTLDRVARGGIYDHLGGGFHRYSTERTWTVPHFEKMLYDNAQLLEVYARALKSHKGAGGKPLYERVLRQTVDFVNRELSSPEGGFYSALDADSEGEEGRFYVWKPGELHAVLADFKENGKLFKKVYGVEEGVNFEGKYHILLLPKPLEEQAAEFKLSPEKLEEKLAPVRRALLDIRSRRKRPFLDTKVLTAWNGQMIAGMALAGDALGDKKAVARAEEAADFLLKNMRTRDGRLLRTWGAAPGEKPTARLNGYLDDYAYLVHGLLTLHDVTGKRRWLAEAEALTDTMLLFHADLENGAFFYTSSDHEKLFARGKDQYDGAQPSANSAAAKNLVRLWRKTGEKRYARQAEKTFESLAGNMKVSPGSLTALAEALSLYLTAGEK